MRAPKYLVVVLACLAVSGCALVSTPDEETATSESSASADPGDSPSAEDEGGSTVDPASYPTSFDAETMTVLPEKPVYDGLMVGARLLTMTLDRITARTLPTLESAWEMSPTGFFVDIEESDEQLYALDLRVLQGAGTSADRLSMTLSLVSPSSGSVLGDVTWEKRQDVQNSGDPQVKIVAIEGDIVLVESSSSGEDSRTTLTAVDMSSQEELWTRRPGSFVASDDGTVVLSTETPAEPGVVTAVDVETGKRLWDGPDNVVAASGVGVHDDSVTIAVESADADSPELAVLSMDDGTLTDSEPTKFVDWSCHPSEDPVVVCALPGERAVGYDLATGDELWQLPTAGRYGIWVTSVRGPIVYGFTSGARSVALDATTGKDITESAGAAPVSSNGYGGIIFYAGQAVFYPALETSDESGSTDSSDN